MRSLSKHASLEKKYIQMTCFLLILWAEKILKKIVWITQKHVKNQIYSQELLKKMLTFCQKLFISVNEGAFPSVFKLADVSPVFFPQFPSSKNSEDNYRSISNLNDLSKVVESIIYKQTATLIGKYFSKFRCGFRKGYSTQQRLIAIIEKWKSAVDSGKSFRALLRDLSKAFDCLPCKLLLAKLNAYDLSLSALRLICSYLFNRQRRTKINASYSSW